MKSIRFEHSIFYKEVKCALEGLNNYFLKIIIDLGKQAIN